MSDNLEKVLYEYNIKIDNKPAKIILTNKSIIIKKEKGIIIKRMRNIYKTAADDVELNQTKKQLIIHSGSIDVTLECDSELEANIIFNKIINIQTNKKFLAKNYIKFKNWKETIIGGVITGYVANYAWSHRKEILNGIKTLFIKFGGK